MLRSLKNDIKDQPLFFGGYLLFLITMSIIVVAYTKKDFTILVNGNWSEFQDSFYKVLTHLGDGLTALVVLLLLCCLKWRYAIIGALGFGISAGITQILKRLVFKEKRPLIHFWDEIKYDDELHSALPVDELMSDNSFPSGHTTSAFSVFFILALVIRNKWFGLLAIILACLIAFSRVYLLQHFSNDIFLGAIIGGLTAWFVFAALNEKKWGAWADKSLLKW